MRRAVERKQKKAACKAALRQANQTLPVETAAPPEVQPETPLPATSQARIDANRANAQHSTGPSSAAGKAISSQNRLTHGLVYTGDNFRVLAGEDQSAFDALLNSLTGEHQPATTSESILVQRMAHHEWLYQRALRLQENCFDPETGEVADAQKFSLYMRYVSQHERGFSRCLNEIARHRKDRQNLAIGFEREKRTQEMHGVKVILKEMEAGYREMRTRQLCREEFGPGNCPGNTQTEEIPPEEMQTAA
jgi:hypothetical protein